jgi:SPP1 family predicted phage head-tail adaptor
MPLSNRLQAGKLRHRIQIVKPDGVQDTMGGVPQNEMSIIANVWADIQTLTGRDMLVSDQFMSEVNIQVTIRWRNDVDASCRIWFNGKTFQVTAVMNPDQRTKMLVLNCVEINDSNQQFKTPLEPTVP